MMKFWGWLGFGRVAPITIPEHPKLPYCYGFQIVMPISFGSALRLLISRRLHVAVASLTDQNVQLAQSTVNVSVLAPGDEGPQA